MEKIYECKTKTIYPYEDFGFDTYEEVVGNLKIKDFKPLSIRLPTKEELDIFNYKIGHKTGGELIIGQ